MVSKRENKGIQLVVRGWVQPIDSSRFLVRSESNPEKHYEVRWERKKWICSCEDFQKRKRKCKHIYAVLYYLTIRDLTIGVRKIGEDKAICPKCGSSENVIRDGFEECKSGFIQRFYCKRCRSSFVARTGFEGMRGQALAIILSLDLYYRGLSLRQIAEHMETVYGISVSYGTIYGWIKRYVEIISEYLNKSKIKTSERWHVDETVVRVKGKQLILWSILDSETRFLIAQHISEGKDAEEAYKLLDKGLRRSENKPLEIITDGAAQYVKAIDKKFGSELKEPILHVQAQISTPLSNNKLERFHKTLKQRFKPISCFHNKKTAETFSKGFTIFYNHIKEHKALNDMTPEQAANQTKSKTSWIRLIEEASKSQTKKENFTPTYVV